MGNRRSSLAAGIAGGLVVGVLMTALPAVAGSGDPLILGSKNNNGGDKTTAATANVSDGPAFKFTNDAGGNRAAVRINTDGTAPPFATNSDRKVVNFNADYLDGLDSQELINDSVAAGAPVVWTNTEGGTFTNENGVFKTIPATVTITVPPGPDQRLLIDLRAISDCYQDPIDLASCQVGPLVDGSPAGAVTVFDNARHSNQGPFGGAHSYSWVTAPLPPGEHTVGITYVVIGEDASFSLGAVVLSAELLPEGNATVLGPE